MKKTNFKFIFILFLILFIFFTSCCTSESSKKNNQDLNDPFTIFKNSLLTSENSSYYLYKNKANLVIFEKKIEIKFMYEFIKDYTKYINQYVNINKISRKKIEDQQIKLFCYESIDLPFNNQDAILKLVFDTNSMKLNDINIYFRIQKWGGMFNEPDLIVMNFNKKNYDDFSKERKISVLLHEYFHYLFNLRFGGFTTKEIINNPENANIAYYINFLNEMFSYFNGDCFFYYMKNEDSLKLTEDKVNMAIRKYIENVVLARSSKDPVALAKRYHNADGYAIFYFYDFVKFLINYKDFDTFVELIKNIY
ncbi:MAG: hypothetical protein WH035_08160, partial [Spirochaetota bacterium]